MILPNQPASSLAPLITVYPTAEIVGGDTTEQQYIEAISKKIYNEWVCDHRLSPVDIIRLLLIACEEREWKQSSQVILSSVFPDAPAVSDVIPLIDACEDILMEGNCHANECECSQCEAYDKLNKNLNALYSKHPTLEVK